MNMCFMPLPSFVDGMLLVSRSSMSACGVKVILMTFDQMTFLIQGRDSIGKTYQYIYLLISHVNE